MTHSGSKKHIKNRKLGLALSAGGAKGAYQLGCWKAFLEKELTFESVSGSSIGALNGALICQGDWNAAYELWREIAGSAILRPDYARLGRLIGFAAQDLGLLLVGLPQVGIIRGLARAALLLKSGSRYGALGYLRRKGVIDISAFKPLLSRYLDMAGLLKQPAPLFITARSQSYVSNPLEWFRLQDQSEEDAWRILAASMAIPFLFSQIEIKGRRYYDGAIGQWLPIMPLYAHGIRNVIAVSTRPMVPISDSAYPGCAITSIAPEKPLGRFPVATFRFTRQAIERWIEQGYSDSLKALTNNPQLLKS
ncbi:MAG: patatin-like phospholipase family protein [Desulfomonilaceae bacterium]